MTNRGTIHKDQLHPTELARLSESGGIHLFGVRTHHALETVMRDGGREFFHHCAEGLEFADRIFLTAGTGDDVKHVTLVVARKETAPAAVEVAMAP